MSRYRPEVISMKGTLLFARYAFMPNRLSYCGGDDNKALFDYCIEGHSDPGLVSILRQFQGAYPYLRQIAEGNLIPDPFDPRVVEAYWIGNELLENVAAVDLYHSLEERFSKHLGGKALGYLLGKAPLGARPHHSFHVFDVHSRVGMLPHSLAEMDKCRISSARIKEIQSVYFVVDYQPLLLRDGKLELGAPQEKRVLRLIDDRGFIENPKVGDYISIHWDWACDTLTKDQAANLDKYTRYHIALANQTM